MYRLLQILVLTLGISNLQINPITGQVLFENLPEFPKLNNHPLVSSDPRFDARISQLLSTNILQLAHDIGSSILTESTEKNEVFSPLSIYGALSLLLLGSNGKTFQELMQLLKFDNDEYLTKNPWKIHEEFGLLLEDIEKDFPNPHHPREQLDWKKINAQDLISITRQQQDEDELNKNNNETIHKISIANGFFIQDGFTLRPEYQRAIHNIYSSTLKNLDFLHNTAGAVKYINKWVKKKTEGKIKEIVPDLLSPETKVIIASALYFNAKWAKTFIEGATGKKKFYPDGLDGETVIVDMMAHGGTFPFYDAKEYDCRILGLPYKKNLTTMYIILPNNSNRTKLRALQSLLTADKINDMISKMEWKTSIILFPKMHIINQVNLKMILRKLGVNTIFDRSQSDLSLVSTGLETYNNQAAEAAAIDVQQKLSSILMDNNRFGQSLPRYPGADDADDSDDDRPIFTRRRKRNSITYKVPSQLRSAEEPLRLKDFIISKRITKGNAQHKKNIRNKRQTENNDPSESIKALDRLRNEFINNLSPGLNPGLYAEEIIHKIDLTVNEKGTEGGAATITYLYRTGTDVVFRVETPFMFLIRHDDTKLPLFYGTVYEPTNDD